VGIERSGKGGGGRGFEGDSLHPIHPTRKIPPNILTKLALENEKGTLHYKSYFPVAPAVREKNSTYNAT
jgi:hypothetical protein